MGDGARRFRPRRCPAGHGVRRGCVFTAHAPAESESNQSQHQHRRAADPRLVRHGFPRTDRQRDNRKCQYGHPKAKVEDRRGPRDASRRRGDLRKKTRPIAPSPAGAQPRRRQTWSRSMSRRLRDRQDRPGPTLCGRRVPERTGAGLEPGDALRRRRSGLKPPGFCTEVPGPPPLPVQLQRRTGPAQSSSDAINPERTATATASMRVRTPIFAHAFSI